MKKNLIFILIIVILIVVGVLIFQSLKKKEIPPEITMPKTLEGKKVVMIIAFRDFRDAEYFVPKEILEGARAEVKTASNKMGIAIGADGGEVEIDFLVSELNPADFDAVIFVGGSGAIKYLDNEDSYRVARETISKGKILGAICIASTILAKAGVLSNRKATVWTSPMDKSAVKILEDNGAAFEDNPVVADGKIITGSGPEAAEEFGMKIVEVLDRNLN